MHAPNKAEVTRERILDAAALVLRRRGLAATKLTEIGKEAGTFAGSLYYHFGSKDELIEAVMLEGIYRNTRHIVSAVEQLGPDLKPMDRFRAAVEAHVRFLITGDNCASAVARVFNELPEEVKTRVVSAYTPFDNYWRDLIADVQRSGDAKRSLDPGLVRMLLLGMLKTVPDWYRPGRMQPETIINQVCELFVGGFAQEPARLAGGQA
jgi:AcrR family transcriptional regulator